MITTRESLFFHRHSPSSVGLHTLIMNSGIWETIYALPVNHSGSEGSNWNVGIMMTLGKNRKAQFWSSVVKYERFTRGLVRKLGPLIIGLACANPLLIHFEKLLVFVQRVAKCLMRIELGASSMARYCRCYQRQRSRLQTFMQCSFHRWSRMPIPGIVMTWYRQENYDVSYSTIYFVLQTNCKIKTLFEKYKVSSLHSAHPASGIFKILKGPMNEAYFKQKIPIWWNARFREYDQFFVQKFTKSVARAERHFVVYLV